MAANIHQKITPTNKEVFFTDKEFIVSKTCSKGHITYINRSFMHISAFKEEELLGRPHNIIRHPDMPRGVFRLLWSTLQAGDEFFGFIKNLCADGSFYWVFANVTPDHDERGKLKGYYSIGRNPNKEGVEAITPIYQKMLAIEAKSSSSAAPAASVKYLMKFVEQSNLTYSQFVLDLYGFKTISQKGAV